VSEAPRKVVPGDRGDFALWHDAVDDVAVWFVGRAPTIEDGLEAAALPRELPRAFLRQIHSSAVLEARDGAHGDLGEGDALVSSARDLVLEIRTADCVPVLVAAGGRIAAIHAGWRGIVSGVVANAVARLSGPRSPERTGSPRSGRAARRRGSAPRSAPAATRSGTTWRPRWSRRRAAT